MDTTTRLIHTEQHPNARQTVTLGNVAGEDDSVRSGAEFVIEDWWDRVAGKSWTVSNGNPAALKYAMRIGLAANSAPLDDEVVYGKIGPFGHLVHVSEISGVTS